MERRKEELKVLRRKKLSVKRQIVILLWAVIFAWMSLTSESATTDINQTDLDLEKQMNASMLTDLAEIPGKDCTRPSITEFPSDLFTQAERRQGWLAVHFIASIYVFYVIAVVCDEYFVPSIEAICDDLHLPSDVAGATFMAIATSSPELFTNIIGTFITKGDIGVGTIVGSAVFNILAVVALCGLAAHTALPLEWYPLTRDCLFYSFSVILLIIVLNNRKVFWYEALVLVLFYAIYILAMYKNTMLKKKAETLVEAISFKFGSKDRIKTRQENDDVLIEGRKKMLRSRRASFVKELNASFEENKPLLGDGGKKSRSRSQSLSESFEKAKLYPNEEEEGGGDISAEALDEMLISNALHNLENVVEDEKEDWSLWRLPQGQESTLWNAVQWGLSWPSRFALTFTIPDCRESKQRKWYPLTFLMCIVWIALLSYVVSWMMTIIGHTLRIPDSVMGLTFIAAGTSIPEAVSSVIVARQGLGTMSISNSIGSNTFDILMCLGLPWLIRSSLIASESTNNFIQINSGGLEYSAMILMASLILLYGILAINKFYLDKKVGLIALSMYGAFLIFASLFEMNVFFTVNLPTCEIFD